MEHILTYHMIAFVCGFVLDLVFGDPHALPHPIRLIGTLIAGLEKKLLKLQMRDEKKEFYKGILLVALVLLCTGSVIAFILIVAYWLHPAAGIVVESVMTYQILATKCLKDESMKVYQSLNEQGLEAGRVAVSMIVGRDTNVLDETGVVKAAVETVAENTSDGVIAPMLYTALGGPVLGFVYKAVNTMDSMVGYKNDVVNFIPARISAYLMITAAYIGGKAFDGKRAYHIYKRDRRNHASPNSAQTESVCAGALGIQLAGDASYFGKVVKKPYIGDAHRAVEREDIVRVNRLMYVTAVISEVLCLVILFVLNCAVH